MIETISICLALILLVPLLAFAMIFAVGAACGVAAYHLSRTVVVHYQPLRKAVDQERDRNKAVAAVRQVAQETAEMQGAYLGGLSLTREQYLAGGNGK